jgi:hypothetical protein
MRRRIIISGFVVALIGAAVAGIAQQPSAVTPSPVKQTGNPPLARFDPLLAQPHQTQAAVRAVLLGANWMTRMNQASGRFLYGYNPALRQPIAGDHDLKQARAALALAQAAKFCGDEKQAAIASQAILALLAATKIDPTDPNCRVPVQASAFCNRVGFAAVLAQAIYELPSADSKLVAEAERLCAFLHKQCRSDGSVHYLDSATDDPMKIDPAGVNEYPGEALEAIVSGNRFQPASWKLDAVKNGLAFYRVKFKANPHPLLAATLAPAAAELYKQSKSLDAANMLFEMNDWLCGLQISPSDTRTPQWAGAFRAFQKGRVTDDIPGTDEGLIIQSLACAYEINRHVPDLTRDGRYKAALQGAVSFICGLQYQEANTRHFENTYRANTLIGGFHMSSADGNLRIDSTAMAVSGLLRFLSCGAEK